MKRAENRLDICRFFCILVYYKYVSEGECSTEHHEVIYTAFSYGGGVFIAGHGIFTMEGGVIMNNTVRSSGGGGSYGQ